MIQDKEKRAQRGGDKKAKGHNQYTETQKPILSRKWRLQFNL